MVSDFHAAGCGSAVWLAVSWLGFWMVVLAVLAVLAVLMGVRQVQPLAQDQAGFVQPGSGPGHLTDGELPCEKVALRHLFDFGRLFGMEHLVEILAKRPHRVAVMSGQCRFFVRKGH